MTGLSGQDGIRRSGQVAAESDLGSLSWSALASLISGLGALGFLTVGRVVVGLADFSPMAHVWTVWSISAATIGFGSQIETVEGLSRNGSPVSRRHYRLGALGVILAGAATFVWREPLFGTASLFWPVMCGVIPVGSMATGIARGGLAARDRKRGLAFVIAGENVVRLIGALILLWLGGTSRSLVWVLLVGFTVAFVGLGGVRGFEEGSTTGRISSGGAGAFAGFVAHLSLLLPPSILALRGEDPAVVAGVFLILTYLRAPYQFILGMGPVLTAQSFGGRTRGWIRWFSDGRVTLTVALVALGGAAIFGLLAGDPISRIMLGRSDIVTPVDFAILCAMVVAVAFSIIRTLVVVARGRSGLVFLAWGTGAGAGLVSALGSSGGRDLFAGLLLAVVACLLLLTLPDFRGHRSAATSWQ